MRLLLVEDDDLLSESLGETLEDQGYAVDIARGVREADALVAHEELALAVVDLGLPDGSGLGLIKRWRLEHRYIPVLILTARDNWEDKVSGLNSGADDYLTKPFHEAELIARLQALLRRAKGNPVPRLCVRDIELDEASQQVRREGAGWQPLTGTEYRLLRYLMRHPDRVLSKDQLLDQLYGLEQDATTPNLVEAYIARLRRKIGKENIETRRRQGYVISARRSS